jgi:uncharacterized protein YvpB
MHKMAFLIVFLLLVGCSGNSQYEVQPKSNVSVENTKTGILEENTGTPNIIKRGISIKEDNKKEKPSHKEKVILNVPIIEQKPELKFGCEVTSLAMLLQYTGIKVDKMDLAKQIPKDDDPVSKNKSGDIIHWGNPNHGFVGDITGKNMGYAVYAQPVEKLMKRYLPNQTVNLTGKSFDTLLSQVQNQKPVLVWTTGDFKSPGRWESWNHGAEKIKTPLDLHVVVLTGFDSNHVYVNDPLTGGKNQKVSKQSFVNSWNALGKQALSYR